MLYYLAASGSSGKVREEVSLMQAKSIYVPESASLLLLVLLPLLVSAASHGEGGVCCVVAVPFVEFFVRVSYESYAFGESTVSLRPQLTPTVRRIRQSLTLRHKTFLTFPAETRHPSTGPAAAYERNHETNKKSEP